MLQITRVQNWVQKKPYCLLISAKFIVYPLTQNIPLAPLSNAIKAFEPVGRYVISVIQL